jgi:hypothetical protein
MKNFFLKRHFLSLLTIGSAALIMTACDKDDDDEDDNAKTYAISGTASGAQEVPAVTTNATGSIAGTYNAGNNTLNYTINWSGLSGTASAAHLHGPADAGVNADVLVPLTVTSNTMDGTASGTVTVTDDVEDALLDGKVYYNVHTVANPNGEIRGQISTTVN